jgi:hypothetical protein
MLSTRTSAASNARTDGDRADLPVARQLDARAVHLGNQDLAQQRQNVTAR